MSFNSASPEDVRLSPSENSPTNMRPTTSTVPRPLPDLSSSRSCVTCRQRKVRCNKRSPCSNCVKANIDCIFPPPGRAPRKSKRPPDAELLSRLRRLEGVIEHLSGKNGEAGPTPSVSPPQVVSSTFPPPVASVTTLPTTTAPAATATVPTTSAAEEPKAANGPCPFEDADPTKLNSKKFENEFGRLVIDEGRSRYVSNRLWASLGDEIEELQDIIDHSSSDEDDAPSPETSPSASHDGFLFGFHSLSHSLREFHPPLPKVSKFWEIYRENVAPLITILHRPTARNLLVEAAQHPESLDKNSEALVFSIYLSAIVTLSPAECVSRLGEERSTAVKRYRFVVEQAMARADLLNTQSLVLLQAAVLFLICVRREDDTKFVWSMTSVILRLAQGLGVHRDGTNFALKPFETEMRRRLWWHICLMDVRTSEDHGTDPLIHENLYDVRLPLNVNDDDIYPEMIEAPTEREGCTDVTFCLIRCEITSALRRANYACPNNRLRLGTASPSLDQCERMIQIVSSRVEERYIRHCDMNVPIQWASATVARLILAKLWLVVHHPMTRRDRATNMSQATRESLFHTAIEVLEFGRLLEADPKTAKWGWLFRTNMQWHGVAFVLSEVCVRPICPVSDRAWNAVSGLFSDWKLSATNKKGMLWRPLTALMKRAAATRAKQQAELRLQFGPQPPSLSPTTGNFVLGNQHNLPQIHMPTESPTVSPNSQTNSSIMAETPPLNVDITSGPWETLQNIFPNTDILATNAVDASFADPVPVHPVSASTMPLGSLPTSLPFNPQYNTHIPNIENLPQQTLMSWDEWDQVMRDFQMEVDKDENGQSQSTAVTDWLA
ncbi:hypothetical protein N7492_002194 [Penicillium capsulatum]|uniref:Zn(2)-C6 fungal-type domain-containing protein n=1 Tax=Penicillium capsulatum TaxID=69766 RepID=A0A9W9IJK8_9EURO|nr:hypothetical protein N7492_002194 [Penicillium capsulatum]KAJ6123198.1 hypothetical protein N7512_005663 [Penicillium capsulatum]